MVNHNMRARTDLWLSNFLLRDDDEVEEVIDEYYVRIPDDMTIPYTDEATSKDALIKEIFPSSATIISFYFERFTKHLPQYRISLIVYR